MITTLGIDPISATLITEVGIPWLTQLLGGGSTMPPPQQGLSNAQIAAILEQQRRAAADRTRTWLYVGGGIAVLGLAAVLLLARRK